MSQHRPTPSHKADRNEAEAAPAPQAATAVAEHTAPAATALASDPSPAAAAASSGSSLLFDRSVVIIGAGLAGLTVASELIRAASSSPALPLRITILEARERIGGRLLSISHNAAASAADLSASSEIHSSLDLGATWHWPHHSSVASLLRALDLSSFRGADSARMGNAARVRGGSQSVAAALWMQIQQQVPAGCAVELKLGTVCSVVEVTESDHRLEAKVTTAAGSSFPARTAVIVAVPPRLALHTLSFRPALSAASVRHLRSVSTWMASSCKVALRFDEPFWRARGLPDEQPDNGQHPDDVVFEWHDASSDATQGEETIAASSSSSAAAASSPSSAAVAYALIGFARPGCSAASVTAQLRRCYSSSGFIPPAAASFHVADWSRERFTSASDRDSAGGHPRAHADLRASLWSDRRGGDASLISPLLLFASSELAESEAGYMEGAVRRGQQVANQIRSSKQWADNSRDQ